MDGQDQGVNLNEEHRRRNPVSATARARPPLAPRSPSHVLGYSPGKSTYLHEQYAFTCLQPDIFFDIFTRLCPNRSASALQATGASSMSSNGSVELWLDELHKGHVSALGKLHERYWPSLVDYARQRMRLVSRGPADEEDIVQAAFLSFYRAFREGRVPALSGRESLLALLTTIIARKAVRKAPGPELIGVDDLLLLNELAQDSEASPVEQAMLKDCYKCYVGGLPPKLRPVAEMCLAGMTHREIAAAIPCAVRTVERKMSLILHLWHDRAAASAE
jgi:DNA-directed RNA polymerase specialized sigma24 family protein